jgi:Holliday junction resolvase
MVGFPCCVLLVDAVLPCRIVYHQHAPATPPRKDVYRSINQTSPLVPFGQTFYCTISQQDRAMSGGTTSVSTELDRVRLRRWRKRGFYSETVLVKLLQKKGYNAVRIPVSNPSLNPLPDIMARKGTHVYAFEVKNASYYAYFPKVQIDKLFRFLDQFMPTENSNKHAVVAAHLGKRWLFKEISWTDWEKDKLPDKVRILKRDRGNLNLDTSYQQQ